MAKAKQIPMIEGGEGPTRNSGDPQSEHQERCAECGVSIDTTGWHLVVAHTDGDGEFQLKAFCTRDCRDAWQERCT